MDAGLLTVCNAGSSYRLVALFFIWRWVILTLMRGGIEWRGTRYGLDELRKAHREQAAIIKAPPQSPGT